MYDDDNGDERDQRWVDFYDDEALQLMQGWWGGQNDPLYAIASSGGNYAWVFKDAVWNLDRDISRVKKLGRNKFQLGNGTFTKKEIDELGIIRDALAYALYEVTGEMREAGRDPRARFARPSRGPSSAPRPRPRSPKREFHIGQDVEMISNPTNMGHVVGFDPDGSVMVQWSGSRVVTGVAPDNLRGIGRGYAGRRMEARPRARRGRL